MKISRNFTIDIEVYEQLQKVANQSELINDLLLKHFNAPVTLEEKKKRLAELNAKIEYVNKLEEIHGKPVIV